MIEMMQMVRAFINFIKANPTTKDQFKANKLATHKEYNNEINESEFHTSSLDGLHDIPIPILKYTYVGDP